MITLVGSAHPTVIETGARSEFDRKLFETEKDWSGALRRGEVRYQWDPDRDLKLRSLERRALQLGIRGTVVRDYVNCWILAIEDVTNLAHSIKRAIAQNQKQLPPVPEEQVYDVSPQIQKTLHISA